MTPGWTRDGTPPLPYQATALDALLWMGRHRGDQLQVPLRVGVELGWGRGEMAQEPGFVPREAAQEARGGPSEGQDT